LTNFAFATLRNSMLPAPLACRFCCASESEIVFSRRAHTGGSAISKMSFELWPGGEIG